MAKVFISYDHEDLDFVQVFAQALGAGGVDVWWDESLKGGDDWMDKIQQAIDDTDMCIVVLTPNSIKSDWVQREYTYAQQQKKAIVPLIAQVCQVPIALVTLNYIDMCGANYQNGLNRVIQLARESQQDRGKKPQPAPAPAQAPPPAASAHQPAGIFTYIGVEHNIVWGSSLGMRIHASLVVRGERNNPCKAIVYFFGLGGQPLRDFNPGPFYGTPDGFVSTAVDFVPMYEETTCPDIQLFIPYPELHLMPGVHSLTFQISLYDVARNVIFAQSLPQPFVVTQQ